MTIAMALISISLTGLMLAFSAMVSDIVEKELLSTVWRVITVLTVLLSKHPSVNDLDSSFGPF